MKNSSSKYVRFLKKMLLVIFSLCLISCLYRKPQDVVISNKQITLTTTPLTIKCPTPLFRNRKSAAVQFQISEDWNIYWPKDGSCRGGVEFKNGKIAFLDVTLTDSEGKTYSNNKGRLSGDFAINFSTLSKSVKIVKITITSSLEIECDKIYWHCYDPI